MLCNYGGAHHALTVTTKPTGLPDPCPLTPTHQQGGTETVGPGKPGPGTKEEMAAKRVRIWQLRLEGNTEREIAAHPDVQLSQTRVHQLLEECYGEITQPTAERLRIEQMHRLDNLRKAANGIIARHTEHDDPTVLAAMDRLLKVDAREAALFGLDAPQQVESRQYSYQVNGVSPEDLR